MAEIVVTGGGVGGLVAAMLLAEDGHDVTLLERDGAEPPGSDRGVGGLGAPWCQPIPAAALLPAPVPGRARARASPRVVKALEAAGALRMSPIAGAPVELTGGVRPGDDDFETMTGRRPMVEAVLAAAALATPGLTVRRGVAVAGPRGGRPGRPGGGPCHRGPDDRRGRTSPPTSWSTPPAGVRRCRTGWRRRGRAALSRSSRTRGSCTTGATSGLADGTTPPIMGPLPAGLRQRVDPDAARRQRHVGGGGDRQRGGQGHAGAAPRRRWTRRAQPARWSRTGSTASLSRTASS